MRGKQSDSLHRTGITITLSSNYPRSSAAVCISPLTDFPSPRCVNKSRSPLQFAVGAAIGKRVRFLLTPVLNWISPFISDCHVFDLPLHPPPPPLPPPPSFFHPFADHRSGAEEGENRVKGRQLASNGRSRGVRHIRSRTQALKKKQLIDSLVH